MTIPIKKKIIFQKDSPVNIDFSKYFKTLTIINVWQANNLNNFRRKKIVSGLKVEEKKRIWKV